MTEKKSNAADISDIMYNEAVMLVRERNECRFSLLQRMMRINFDKATRLCDLLVERGVVAEPTSGFDHPVLSPEECGADT